MIALLLCAALPAEPPPSAEWIELFNGRDFAGWNYVGTPGGITVEDGAMKLRSAGPDKQAGHLFYIGSDPSQPATFRDFELEIVSKAEPGSNSGVFFHTTTAVRNRVGHLADGYEVQLNNIPSEKHKTGSLYAVEIVPESPVDEADWFTMRVVVRGDRIQVDVEGERVVDYVEPPNVVAERPKQRKGRHLRAKGGLIALQAHDPESIWWVRSVRVRPLSAE